MHHRRPDVLALSVTMKSNLKHVRAVLEALRKLTAPPQLLVGGQAAAALARRRIEDFDLNVASDLMNGMNLALTASRWGRPKADLMEYLAAIGRRVRELRTTSGHTQAQLAESAGLNRAYIVSVERGKQNISMGVIIKIANALGVAVEQLLPA